MSVKFEKETFHTAAAVADAAGKGKDDFMHGIGQAITGGGGPNGYLTVSCGRVLLTCWERSRLTGRATGIPQAAAEQPAAHQDADLGHPFRPTRVFGLVDCARQEQVGPLLHLARSQDGHLRRPHQRAPWTRLD